MLSALSASLLSVSLSLSLSLSCFSLLYSLSFLDTWRIQPLELEKGEGPKRSTVSIKRKFGGIKKKKCTKKVEEETRERTTAAGRATRGQ